MKTYKVEGAVKMVGMYIVLMVVFGIIDYVATGEVTTNGKLFAWALSALTCLRVEVHHGKA